MTQRSTSILLLLIALGVCIYLVFLFSVETEVRAKIKSVSNEEVLASGVGKLGYQELSVLLLEGSHQGETVEATNHLTGSLEIDNFYQVGETILVAIMEDDEGIKDVKAIDLYRLPWEVALFVLFLICLLVYAGATGVRALFSFLTSVVIIWFLLIKGFLANWPPLLLTVAALILLSAIILFSIAGFTKKGFSAFLGTVAGLVVILVVTLVFGEQMGLNGMTSPFAQTLLIKGHFHLNMRDIFFSSIILGASGAAMDIAMDIAASIEEIHKKRPDISYKELVRSGFNIGRAVIGTMTTTLLLAYSGGSLTLLMLFSSQETSFTRIVNFKVVAAEILRILSGSIGLVMVAPLTAIIASWIMVSKKEHSAEIG